MEVEKLNQNELLSVFQNFITNSGIIINKTENLQNNLKNFYKLDVTFNNKNITIFANLRNISSAYLPNKPYIKRRQVGKLNIDSLYSNTHNSVSVLVGIAKIQNDNIVAMWNPFYFIGHQTNRSCYILEQSMEKALLDDVYVGDDCRTPVYSCNKKGFAKLLEIYIERNTVD